MLAICVVLRLKMIKTISKSEAWLRILGLLRTAFAKGSLVALAAALSTLPTPGTESGAQKVWQRTSKHLNRAGLRDLSGIPCGFLHRSKERT